MEKLKTKRPYLTSREAAEEIGISPNAFRRWTKKNNKIKIEVPDSTDPNKSSSIEVTVIRTGPRNDRRVERASLKSLGFDGKKLLTTSEVAELLKVHANTVRKWEREGWLRAFRVGVRRDRRFPMEGLKRLLNMEKESPD